MRWCKSSSSSGRLNLSRNSLLSPVPSPPTHFDLDPVSITRQPTTLHSAALSFCSAFPCCSCVSYNTQSCFPAPNIIILCQTMPLVFTVEACCLTMPHMMWSVVACLLKLLFPTFVDVIHLIILLCFHLVYYLSFWHSSGLLMVFNMDYPW